MTTDWAKEYLAAAEVYDFSQDPDDYKVTRQSKVTIGGLLIPVSADDSGLMDRAFTAYGFAYHMYRGGSYNLYCGFLLG